MSMLALLLIAGVIFIIAYFTYGKFLDSKLDIDPNRKTPAITMHDGIDYVAARKPVLLGHHFATIAGGGPIIGPITAVAFGWIPAVLWIILGSIFVGGVHDYAALQASIRHRAESIGTIIKEYIGQRGQTLFLVFSIAVIILIVGVFIILVADTFAAVPEAATASIIFMILALLFGFAVNQLRINFATASILGVIGMFLAVWLGVQFPLNVSASVWVIVLIAYAYIASVLPVWLLLQPRDYLNSFLLYGMIIGGTLGIIIMNPVIQLSGYTGFYNANLGFLFPILFITIACGAISGFHSLVSSGTTAKQLDSERNGKFIAYGGMLLEGFLAIISIGSVAYLTQAEYAARLADMGGPVGAFSAGIGYFMTGFGVPEVTGVAFTALTASAFLLTTLDSATRLGKYGVQELSQAHLPKAMNHHLATVIVLLGAGGLALSGTWSTVWPLFGSANQLLGALTLLAISVWLIKKGVKAWFTIIPMVFMFVVTISALGVLIQTNFSKGNWFLTIASFILLVLCVFLIIEAWKSLGAKDKDSSVKV